MLGNRRVGVFFALLERHDLSGTRLAGAHVARAGERARCRAFLVDPDHGVLHDFQIPGLERYGPGGLGLDASALARDRVLDIVDEMRAEHHTVEPEASRRSEEHTSGTPVTV